MRRNQSLVIVFVVSSFFIFFLLNMRLETTTSPTRESGVPQALPIQELCNSDVTLPKKNIFVPCPPVHTVSVSDQFVKTMTPNGAYWSRLLSMALKTKQNSSIAGCNWSQCKDLKTDLLKVNVHDFNSYSSLFQDFLQGMMCRSPPILINQPKKCLAGEGNGNNQTFLLFAIKSTTANFERRQALRETWGREGLYENGLRVQIVFLLGISTLDDPNLNAVLSFEARQYQDILQWDFNESFFNLTLKMNSFLQWTLENCPRVSYVFSGDDDVFVNFPALLRYLQDLEPSKASKLYVGQIISTANPILDPNNKYYIPTSFYEGSYPTYAGGGGFILSGALLKPLYSISQMVPFFPIDDVYIGMCILALGVSPEAHDGFQTFDIKQEHRNNLCITKNLIMIHQRTPQQMKRLWKGIHNPLLNC
ncbi:N-acetyllactosaminide beta-1,3-N-acetylglucosaminyltransferase 2 [Antennarius striatus]|uniref:N-acetyllactosaminide beta-1,3-N-acetylglucosaminyltransferase 2 n=1 Tax=Antennarius striatus TaxID=241820 RepID=UPI0035B3E6F7